MKENLMCKGHKTSNKKSRKNWDRIFRGKKDREEAKQAIHEGCGKDNLWWID